MQQLSKLLYTQYFYVYIMSSTRARALQTRGKSQSPESTERLQPVVFRYERYQDTIKVNSIETETPRVPSRGLAHWQLLMKKAGQDIKPALDHIDYHKHHEALRSGPSYTPNYSPEAEPSSWASVRAPSPPPSPSSYDLPIYAGTTHNPAIFIAILRIAQTHLPHTNLVSALNHIPNLDPRDPIPELYPSAPGNLAPQPFLDDKGRSIRFADTEMTVVFLPYFYSHATTAASTFPSNEEVADKRHAIGFYHAPDHESRGRVVESSFFTPCEEDDLRRWGLVRYLSGREWDGVDAMMSIGVNKGRWLERDVVEEYEEWKRAWQVVTGSWERRMALSRGAREG